MGFADVRKAYLTEQELREAQNLEELAKVIERMTEDEAKSLLLVVYSKRFAR